MPLHPIFTDVLVPYSPGVMPTPKRVVCLVCSGPMALEMEHDIGICCECQRSEGGRA